MQHSTQHGETRRNRIRTNALAIGERRSFTSVHGERSTPASTNELAQRAKFKVVRLAAINRSMDLSHLTYDQMDFIAERKAQGSAFKYTTYKGWLFGKAWKCYDASTGQVNMPERLNTIR